MKNKNIVLYISTCMHQYCFLPLKYWVDFTCVQFTSTFKKTISVLCQSTTNRLKRKCGVNDVTRSYPLGSRD